MRYVSRRIAAFATNGDRLVTYPNQNAQIGDDARAKALQRPCFATGSAESSVIRFLGRAFRKRWQCHAREILD